MKRHEFNTLVDGLIGDLPETTQDRFTMRFAGADSYMNSTIEVCRKELTADELNQVQAAAKTLGFKDPVFEASEWGCTASYQHKEHSKVRLNFPRWLVPQDARKDDE